MVCVLFPLKSPEVLEGQSASGVGEGGVLVILHKGDLPDTAMEMARSKGHHHRSGKCSLGEAAQVLRHGDNGVGSVVLHGIGPVGVRVEDDHLVGATWDEADQIG